jgi:hypothetical protein
MLTEGASQDNESKMKRLRSFTEMSLYLSPPDVRCLMGTLTVPNFFFRHQTQSLKYMFKGTLSVTRQKYDFWQEVIKKKTITEVQIVLMHASI